MPENVLSWLGFSCSMKFKLTKTKQTKFLFDNEIVIALYYTITRQFSNVLVALVLSVKLSYVKVITLY